MPTASEPLTNNKLMSSDYCRGGGCRQPAAPPPDDKLMSSGAAEAAGSGSHATPTHDSKLMPSGAAVAVSAERQMRRLQSWQLSGNAAAKLAPPH